MINEKVARHYKEQLHPAFAGYLHDGEITDKDVLATMFKFIDDGVLVPLHRDNNVTSSIESLRLTNIKPKLKFEDVILSRLFNESKIISANDLMRKASSLNIADIIKNNLKAILQFPIIKKELSFKLGKNSKVEFSVNGNKIDTVEKAKFYKYQMFILDVIFFVVGVGLIWFGISRSVIQNSENHSKISITDGNIEINYNNMTGGPTALILTSVIMLGVSVIMYLSYAKSKKVLKYHFEDEVIPIIRTKYNELYEFIKNRPIDNKRINKEFLAYAIAFGLDKNFYKDFGIKGEFNLDETPMTSKESENSPK